MLPAIRLMLLVLWLAPLHVVPAAAQQDWTGEWQTYWRGGLAQMFLTREGDRVTGTYVPDDGVMEGTAADGILRGTWREPGSEGRFVFALSEDGQSFTGRFGNGEFWNGQRVAVGGAAAAEIRAVTPRQTLENVLLGGNAAFFRNDAGALRRIAALMEFEDDGAGANDHTQRRYLLWEISDMATLRIGDAPEGPDMPGGDIATFRVRPLVGDAGYDFRFRRGADGLWRMLVDPLEDLQAAHDAMLDSLGFEHYADFAAANAASPRNTLRHFVEGTQDWESGGRPAVMATLDLSNIPPRLRSLEGEILSDYLREILNRVGYGPWQEIPNLTAQTEPYLFYPHPAGSVVIERLVDPETAAVRWLFSAETLRTAPAVYRAIQALPPADGVAPLTPLSPYFRVRETLREADPRLLNRHFGLESWQWLGILASLALAAATAALAAFLVPRLLRGAIRAGGFRGETGFARWLWRPAALAGFVLVLMGAYSTLGLSSDGGGIAGRALAVAAVVAAASLAIGVVAVVGRVFLDLATSTKGYMDEIVTSLAIGLAKVVIVVVAIILAADVVGLPYEGVLTGLGIGGIALAFAARETVSNLLGGAILLADRPFKRGDLIEVESKMAVIETVGLRSTRLRTPDDTLMVVPNSRLSDQPIANWGSRRRRRVRLLIGLTYDTPPDKVQAFRDGLVTVYKEQPRTDHDEFYAGVRGFAESAIEIEMIGFLKVYAFEAQVNAQHAWMLDIMRLAEKLGVSFAFPTRTIHVAPAEAAAEAETEIEAEAGRPAQNRAAAKWQPHPPR